MNIHRRIFRPDPFLTGMCVAVALAWLFPDAGAQGGWLYPELLTKAGVALIFFLHGLSLSFVALRAGAMRWKLHLVVQAATFIFFPLLGWAGLALAGDALPKDLAGGFFFLCALPSTVSSSVALTAAAGGNVAAAVFNATLSSLLGIVLTPLWMALLLHESHALPVGEVIIDLLRWLLLPLLLGQLFRPMLGGWAARHKRRIHLVDRGTILLLVYTSFCDSVKWDVWHGVQPPLLALCVLAVGVLLLVALAATRLACRSLAFPPEDEIAAVFCGSKKSLAQGVPMAQVMFAGNPAIGLLLLPILLYHPLQLFVCGILAGRWARRKAAA